MKKIKLIYDRKEKDKAILVDKKGNSFYFPISVLSSQAREGDVFTLTLTFEEGESKKSRREISKLIQKLQKNE